LSVTNGALRRFFLLPLLSPTRLSSCADYLGPLFGRELFNPWF
jgi:hypothetical protein